MARPRKNKFEVPAPEDTITTGDAPPPQNQGPKVRVVTQAEVDETTAKAKEYFGSARMAAIQAMPYCAPAIRALNPVYTMRVPTMAIDKYYRVYVNPFFTVECYEQAAAVSETNPCPTCTRTTHNPIAHIAGILCHEAWHTLRDHQDRAALQNITRERAMIWNLAVDCEINDDLYQLFTSTKDPKIQLATCLPNNLIHPELYNLPSGRFGEEYYYELLNMADKMQCSACGGSGKKQKGQGKGQGKQEQGQSDGQGESQGGSCEGGSCQEEGHDYGGEEPCDCCNGTGKHPNPFGARDWDHGSIADGLERDWELGEDSDIRGLSELEKKMIRKEVAKKISEAAKTAGNISDGMKRWADKELEGPKYDWRSELRKVVRYSLQRCTGDLLTTFRKLGRRTAALSKEVMQKLVPGYKAGPIFPSTVAPLPRVVVVQDTSGSMCDESLKISMTELRGILKGVNASVGFINCDCASDKVQEISGNASTLKLHGGGGTDMRVGIEAAMKSKPAPDIVILFTDGYTPWPDKPLNNGRTQLIVGLVGNHACDVNEVPSWAKVVKIVGDDVVVRPKAA